MINIQTNGPFVKNIEASGDVSMIASEISYSIGTIFAAMYAQDKEKAMDFKKVFKIGLESGLLIDLLFDEKRAKRLVDNPSAGDAELMSRVEVDLK